MTGIEMITEFKLKCISCGKEYMPKKGRFTCDQCGPLMGTLEVLYDYETVKRSCDVLKNQFSSKAGMYQFDSLLPAKSQCKFDEYIGGTPLYGFEGLLGQNKVLIKYEGSNPSSSYKDRASTIAINRALAEGYNTIFCASTGNAASSLAMLSANTTLETYIFVPATIPGAKRTQLEIAGAHVLAVESTYDEVFDLSLDIGMKKGWYTRHSAVNPYLLEGKKTGAYEIIVQNNYKVPDYVFVGVGDGTVISGICKGFKEFMLIGLTDKMPKVIGVQAENIAAVKAVYDAGAPYVPHTIVGTTIADSISVGNPRDVIKACKYVNETGGKFITVSDEEIINAILEMGKDTGLFSEPAGAVSYGGLKKMIASGEIQSTDEVCIIITGNGLKDVNAVSGIIKNNSYSIEEIKERFR